MDIDTGGAAAPADTGSVASNEPVIAATPAPVAIEPRTVPPGEAAERARQAEEAKLPADKADPKKGGEPAAEKAKPISTREALRKAAEKVNAEPAKDANVVAEKAAPLKDSQPRAVDGKFAANDPATAAAAKEAPKAEPAKAAPAADATKPIVETKAAPEPKPASVPAKDAAPAAAEKEAAKAPLPSYTASAPPSRFSPDAKEAWATAPEPVRAEVARMERELTAGFEKHRAAAERDGSIAEFHEMAVKGGTTVKEALAKYVGMENQLRADPIKGLEIICQNAGMSLREVAAHIMGQTPEQQASQTDATMRELRAKIAELETKIGGTIQNFEQQRTQTTQQKVEAFAAAHPRFEELSDDIAFFMKAGRTKDLAEAYSLAERLNPAPAKAPAPAPELPAPASSAAAVAEVVKAAPDLSVQTERGSKSIAGAPTAGSDPVRRQPSTSIREALRKAAAAAG